MPTPINPSQFPAYIYGLHDIGGQADLFNASRPGWLVDPVDLRTQVSTDYTTLAQAGMGVIVRLNHADPGSIPPVDQYDAFAAQCAAYAANSPGARVWLIGDEMNAHTARPVLADGSRDIITPQKYAQCFSKCRSAIKNLPGHGGDLVIPGALAPANSDTGDWVKYLVDLLTELENQVDGIALHCFTQDLDATQVSSAAPMDAPHQNRHAHFRAYRDFLLALPTRFRALPVFITETSPRNGWRDANVGWIQAAYREINDWNADPAHQPIQALALFRWHASADQPAWGIQDKSALIADWVAALEAGYRVRWATGAPALAAFPAQTPGRWLARFLAHDTPVSLSAGQTTTVNLRLKNAGTKTWKQSSNPPVHLGYQWFDAAGNVQRDVDDRRTALPGDVAVNDETTFGAILVAPKTPGAYTLRWDLIAEGVTWFADAGGTPLVVPVAVTLLPQDINGWRAEASLHAATVARALDGDQTTFWESGVPQAAGQWFRLNLGVPRVVDGVQFLSSGNGLPASYVLRVSANGAQWNEVARVASDNAYNVMAVFAPQKIQYVQIDLLGPAPVNWSISEILIHAAPMWTASASHRTDLALCAIDNCAETVWSSGVPQTPGMWFQLDLGHSETISGVTLASPPSSHPVGFRVAVWDVTTNRWHVVCERADNHAAMDVAFPATQTQFINIQLTQASDEPWTIQHARIARELDTWLGPAT